MNMKNEELCPCQSGKIYGECCGPVLEGKVKAETAEQLMRARYSAYVTGHVEFLRDSSGEAVRKEFNLKASKAWSEAASWHGLKIIATEQGGKDDERGVVEFEAQYSARNEFCNHHEISTFIRENGDWKFEDGHFVSDKPMHREEPKVGRNDLCPCGSGKKYKKCCGRG